MKKTLGSFYGFTIPGKIDWRLLIFLLFFLNVKLVIKIAAVFLVYILRPDFKFGFRLKNSRLPLFYLLVIGITLVNWLISRMTSNFNYNLVLITGIFFWSLCILAIHQIKLSVEKNDPSIIHRTIVVFFIINALASLFVYAGIVWETGAINAYRYQGNYQKYFIGTGDYIKGISFDTSTTNAVLNAFGVIYFLSKGKHMLAILCMAVLLLTGSNISNLFLCSTLLFMFFFQSNKEQKSTIIICLLMLITFLIKISPENNKYVAGAYQRLFNKQLPVKEKAIDNIPITQKPDSILTGEEKKQKIAQLYLDSINISIFEKKQKRSTIALTTTPVTEFKEKPVIPGSSIHTQPFQHVNDTTVTEKKLLQFVESNNAEVPISAGLTTKPTLPGKVIALQQTFRYFKAHPGKMLMGTGIGNFSSKLAFRSTAMKIAGGYPAKYTYINEDFKSNHLDLYLYYFSNVDELHSIGNSPNSTYDQLLSEYGVAGLVAFGIFYIGFFVKQFKKQAYAIPLLLFMLVIFSVDYWFEQLSVIIFLELLLLLNIKEINTNSNHAYNET